MGQSRKLVHIEPYFAKKSFFELTKYELKKFVPTLKHKIGHKKALHCHVPGSLILSASSGSFSTMPPMKFHWDVPDPFNKIDKLYPNTPPLVREIFRYEEWLLILDAIPPWNRPMLEMMMLTGMIHSEISGLLRSHIHDDHIFLQRSIVRKVEKSSLKNKYRPRKLPIM